MLGHVMVTLLGNLCFGKQVKSQVTSIWQCRERDRTVKADLDNAVHKTGETGDSQIVATTKR